jgi:uncharacterized protein YfaP (DUF2135 family)
VDGLVSTNPAAQVVEVVPWRDLEVRLTWDHPVDLDLHVLAPDGTYYGDEDCFFGNPTPDWGLAGVGDDDPFLATDDDGSTAGPAWGPETVDLPAPEEGVYQAIVVYWNDRGHPTEVSGQVEVWGSGQPLATADFTVGAVGDAVVLGSLDWTTLGWTADGSATTHDALGGPPFNL